MDMLGSAIRGLKLPGLRWGETFEPTDVAFNIKKLTIQAIIEDGKIETQQVQDVIQKLRGGPENKNLVRSVEFRAFTKV